MEIEDIMKRLAFVKHIYKVGVEQSRKPEPFCWLSVLTFHDAVEPFFRTRNRIPRYKEKKVKRYQIHAILGFN